MIRVALALSIAAAAGCSGPSAPVPTGFPEDGACRPGPRISGTAGMGVGNDGFITDVDAEIGVAARTGGGCVRASFDDDD